MSAPSDPIVATSRGRVRGRSRPGSAAFLGIPFAQPPVGALRFAAPAPVEPWDGVRDALEYGATPQRSVDGVTLIPEPSVAGDATLTVNVFTPAPGDRDAKLPVLVWIHGGAYISGSPASPWYDGAAFARDGVVTVSLSYRLGFDGFGEIDGAPSNRGVLDWLAALRWVRDEIRAFGGDPESVTIAGQSAGGGAVLTLLSMPAARGLFHGVLALSPAFADVPLARAREVSERLAHLAGVEPTLAGFRSVSEIDLLALQQQAGEPEGGRLARITAMLAGLSWGPVVDGDLVPRATPEGLRREGSGIPLLVGAADDEMTMVTERAKRILRIVPPSIALRAVGLDRDRRRAYLSAVQHTRRRGTTAIVGGYASDRVFRSAVVESANARGTAPTWVYRFAWPSPTIGWACHCLDVPFWFDCLDAERVDAIAGDSPPRELATEMHAVAVRFVREGSADWDPWSRHPGRSRVFGGPPSQPELTDDGFAAAAALL